MATLSVCLIIKNEENCLERCLSSIKAIADEIIVIDTGSTDNSVEIASEFGAEVYFIEWLNDFSSARNYSLDQASGEWILIIDADEELDQKCLQLIKIKIQMPDVDAYLLSVTSSCQKNKQDLLELPDFQLRLFRNNSNYRYRGYIHEQILDSILEHNPLAVIKTAPEMTIIHCESNPRDNGEEYRLERNLNLINRVLKKENANTSKYFLLGREYYRHYKYSEALKYLKLACQNYHGQTADLPILLRLIILCFCKLNKMSEAMDFLNDALITRSGSADLYFFKGVICLALGLYSQANHALEKALSYYPCPPYRDILFYHAKYTCQLLLGALSEYFMDMDNALFYYLESLKDNPYLAASLRRMITILDPRQNPEYTVNSLNKVLDLSHPSLQIELATIYYDEGAYQLALDGLNKLETGGQMTERARLLKGLCLLRLKNFSESEKVLLNITYDPKLFIEARQYLFILEVIKNNPSALEYLEQIKNSGADATTLYVLSLLTNTHAYNAGIISNEAYSLAKKFMELTVEITSNNQIAKIFNSLRPLLGKRPSILLAQLFYQYGKFELAKKEYLSLIKTGWNFPLIFYYLGKTYWALGYLDLALQSVDQAMSNGLDTPKIKREKDRLIQDFTLVNQKNKLCYSPDNNELNRKIEAINEVRLGI